MNQNRATLATAQVLPKITRKMISEDRETPKMFDNNSSEAHAEALARHKRAAELTNQSAPMYEGYMSYSELYNNNLGIMGMQKVEI